MTLRIPRLLPFATVLIPAVLLSIPAEADVGPEPPYVQIASPTDGQTFTGSPAVIDVELDGYGGDEGVAEIILRIDDQDVATLDDTSAWVFTDVAVEEGTHTLVAVAISAADADEYPSNAVSIVVFAGSSDDHGGCACDVDDATRFGGGGLLALGLLSLGLVRRRRRPSN